MNVLYITNNGKDWTPLINIDTAILLANEIRGMVVLETYPQNAEVVYVYGDDELLAKRKYALLTI